MALTELDRKGIVSAMAFHGGIRGRVANNVPVEGVARLELS